MNMAVKGRDQKLVVLIKRSSGESAEVASNSAAASTTWAVDSLFCSSFKGHC
jgi:hypothetical protein